VGITPPPQNQKNMKATNHFKRTIQNYLEQRIETVEFSLSKMQVVQSRGVCNKNTEYHDRIIELVKKNRRKIRQRMAA
jgi:hypothetical protein